MPGVVEILRAVAIMVAAIIIGSWFLKEFKGVRAKGQPGYTAYFSIPGLFIIIIAVILPVVVWVIQN